jgi:hypothetical protein
VWNCIIASKINIVCCFLSHSDGKNLENILKKIYDFLFFAIKICVIRFTVKSWSALLPTPNSTVVFEIRNSTSTDQKTHEISFSTLNLSVLIITEAQTPWHHDLAVTVSSTRSVVYVTVTTIASS